MSTRCFTADLRQSLRLAVIRSRLACVALVCSAMVLIPGIAAADESGISFWLPGLYGSLAATPATPGWSVAAIYYHTSVNASGAAAASREFQVGRFSPTVNVNLNLALSGQADLMFVAPTSSLSFRYTQVWSGHLPSWADLITAAPAFKFSVHTGTFDDYKSGMLASCHGQ
jgi:hypothetical protein